MTPTFRMPLVSIVPRMRACVLTCLVLALPALAEQPEEYAPAPAYSIDGYSEAVFPCKEVRGWKVGRNEILPEDEATPEYLHRRGIEPFLEDVATYVECNAKPHLETLSLRELSILRNTIFARYGWGGFRKPWLREYFQRQPWYKPDPKFSYKRLSENDRRNVELIAQAELSLRYIDLEQMRDTLLSKAGKWWGDIPSYEEIKGRSVHACDVDGYDGLTALDDGTPLLWVEEFQKAVTASKDCTYHGAARDELKKHRDNKPVAPNLGKLAPEDRIELGLISRAMGDFAVDSDQHEQAAGSLDKVLSVKELRQLSLRDLRLLRNTIFARRGRSFKSQLLQEHFSHMPWYKPDPAYSDKLLTKTDKRNIELIRQVEQEFGGALTDKDFQVANPSTAEDPEYVPPQLTA